MRIRDFPAPLRVRSTLALLKCTETMRVSFNRRPQVLSLTSIRAILALIRLVCGLMLTHKPAERQRAACFFNVYAAILDGALERTKHGRSDGKKRGDDNEIQEPARRAHQHIPHLQLGGGARGDRRG